MSIAEIGDNTHIKSIVERMMRLLDDKESIEEDIKELKKEAKGQGFNMKALNLVIKEHRKPIEQEIKITSNLYFKNSGGQYLLFGEDQ